MSKTSTNTTQAKPIDPEPKGHDRIDNIGTAIVMAIIVAPLLGAAAHLTWQWFLIGWNWI